MWVLSDLVIHINEVVGLAVLSALVGGAVAVWKWATGKDKRFDDYRADMDKAEEARRKEDREMLTAHIKTETVLAPLLEKIVEALEENTQALERWSE